MFKHITPPSSGSDHTEQAAEPPNSRRFADQRGIALQTIIILVVMLAIAGAVAAVILTRAGEETSNLEETDSAVYSIGNKTGCRLGDGTWTEWANAATYTGQSVAVKAALARAGINQAAAEANKGICLPTP